MAYGSDSNEVEENHVMHDEGDEKADAFAAVAFVLLAVAAATTFVATL